MRIVDFHTHLDDRWFDTLLLSQEAFLAGMDRSEIQIACVYTLMGFFEDTGRANDVLLERASKNADRLLPFITVDPKLGEPAVAELDRCIAKGKFRGVKFHPWLQAFAPSMVKTTMVAILERAAEADLPVVFHDGTPPYATSFQVAATARWVPRAKIVLGHAGLADYNLPAAQLVRDIEKLYACVSVPSYGEL
jgi:predicted TIM-barrel fold metal-dependent hydrolase